MQYWVACKSKESNILVANAWPAPVLFLQQDKITCDSLFEEPYLQGGACWVPSPWTKNKARQELFSFSHFSEHWKTLALLLAKYTVWHSQLWVSCFIYVFSTLHLHWANNDSPLQQSCSINVMLSYFQPFCLYDICKFFCYGKFRRTQLLEQVMCKNAVI